MRDRWRKALMAMPSEAFLDLMRAYLGGVRTPYRKDELIERLEATLRRGDAADRILSLVDESDATALSAAILLDGPSREELADFLELEREEAAARIVNLEERLLLFEDPSPRGEALRPVPALADGLRRVAWEPALLFPAPRGQKKDRGPGAGGRLDPLSLLALASFFSAEERAPAVGPDGSPRLRAKAAREFDAVFPAWDARERASLLASVGVLRAAEDSFVLDRAALERAARDPESFGFRAAAAALGEEASEETVRGLAAGIALMPPDRTFDAAALRRFLRLGLRRHAPFRRREASRLDAAAAALEGAGLLARAGNGWERGAASSGRGGGASLGADFSVVIDRGAALDELPALASLLEPERFGTAAEFTITRVGAARAFQHGLDSVSVLRILRDLTGKEVPQNVAYSIEAWEREHRSVAVSTGTVVSGDERLSRFMENSPVVRDFVVAILAPGVYLTSFRDAAEAREALRKAGLDTPPRVIDARQRRHAVSIPQAERATRRTPREEVPEPLDLSARRAPPPLPPERVIEAMRGKVASLESAREVKEALNERIGLRIALADEAMSAGAVKRERGEAGGLDYLGKVKLAEQAVHEPSWLLSVLYRAPSGESERAVLRPLRVKKGPSGAILEGKREAGAGDQAEAGPAATISIPIERISLLRRIRTSLFG